MSMNNPFRKPHVRNSKTPVIYRPCEAEITTKEQAFKTAISHLQSGESLASVVGFLRRSYQQATLNFRSISMSRYR